MSPLTAGMEPSQGGYNVRLLDRSGPTPEMEPSQGDYKVKLSDRNRPDRWVSVKTGRQFDFLKSKHTLTKQTQKQCTHTQWHSRPVFP